MKRKLKLDWMIVGTLLSVMFYSATYPYIFKTIASSIDDSFFAANQIVGCLSVIISGCIWNKTDKLFKCYPLFCIMEVILNFSVAIWVIMTQNIIAYYILDTIILSVVTRNIICGNIKLKSLRYNTEKDRQKFDNNNNSASSIATIIGSCVAMLINLDFNTMLIIATIGNSIDNIISIVVFMQMKRKSKF